MNYAQKYYLFFPFFIKIVVNKSKAYSFLIFGMMHLQNILLSVKMLRFHFFTAKQGTWVHKDDRGPVSFLKPVHAVVMFVNWFLLSALVCCLSKVFIRSF